MLYEGKTRHCTRRLSEGMGKNINEPQQYDFQQYGILTSIRDRRACAASF